MQNLSIEKINKMRQFLREDLVEKCERRTGYSLRAFARYLDIEPSNLSKILNGKRGISKLTFNKIFNKLDLTPERIESLNGEAESVNSDTLPLVKDRHLITNEEFSIISNWYHYATLELTKVICFESNIAFISKHLGISLTEAKMAVERLIKYNYLKYDDNHQLIDNSGFLTTIGGPLTSSSLRKFQKQMLLKAIDAMEEIPLEERDQTSLTIAIDENEIPRLKKLIKNFRHKLNREMSDSKIKSRVYHFSFSFFPVSKKHQQKDELYE